MVKFDVPPPPRDIREKTLREAIDYFLSSLYAAGASQQTVKAYRAALTDFSLTIGSEKKVSQITQEDVSMWIKNRLQETSKRGRDKSSSLFESKRSAQLTMHYYTLFLRGFFKWLGIDVYVPIVKKPPRRKIETLSSSEVNLLLASSRDTLDLLIVSLLFETGLRAREAVELRLADIDFSSNAIRVRAAKYGEERIVFFGPLTRAALERWLQENPSLKLEDRLLGISYSGLYKRLKTLAKRAGIPPQKVRPHVLRHTFATEALRRGVTLPAVQRLLGHHDIKVTEIYLHLVDDDIRRQYSSAFGYHQAVMAPGYLHHAGPQTTQLQNPPPYHYTFYNQHSYHYQQPVLQPLPPFEHHIAHRKQGEKRTIVIQEQET